MKRNKNNCSPNSDIRNRKDHRIARHLFRTHPMREVIRFYSVKNRCVVWIESFLELTACLIREFDSSIVAYATQPKRIRYRVEDKFFLYTPDAAVLFDDGTRQFEEIKPNKAFASKRRRDHFERLQTIYIDQIGIPLVHNSALDGSNCKTPQNLEFLYRYLGIPYNVRDISILLDASKNVLSIGELIETCSTLNLQIYIAYQSIAYKHFKFNPHDSVINHETQLRRVD